jgi:UDP-GlcNAc3NAcA epimerase
MRIMTIVGARPQFIKAHPISKEIRKNHEEIIIHTGQHYDYNMSGAFFEELGIPKPDYNLGINSSNESDKFGKMILEIGKLILELNPDLVIVYGDTDSTLAGAIAANKNSIKLAHIESGLRSFDKSMPEEINRIITDQCATFLFCPTKTSVENLKKEGIERNVYNSGDVMYDAILSFKKLAKKQILDELNLKQSEYFLATIHRKSNTNNKENLKNILEAFKESNEKIVFPIHPRTKKFLEEHGLNLEMPNVKLIPPVTYLEMLALEENAKKILTDSGGIQKEAFFLKVPCITLRDNTEWTETVSNGWNILVGADKEKIINAINNFNPKTNQEEHYGDGKATEKIVSIIEKII